MPTFRWSFEGGLRLIPWSGTFTVGRGDENDLVLPDGRVSRQHARVWQTDDICLIEDLGSANGTFLERGHDVVRVAAPRPLQPGDAIRIGSARLVFEGDPPPVGPVPLERGETPRKLSSPTEAGPPTLGFGETRIGRVVPLMGGVPPEASGVTSDEGALTLPAAKRRIAEFERRIAELEAELAKARGEARP